MRIHYRSEIIDGCQARVVYDNERQEYKVKLYREGKKIEDATYHTGDKQDAISTADRMVEDSGFCQH